MQFSHFNYLLLCELCCFIFASFLCWNNAPFSATLRNHVVRILFWCSKLEVFWIAARWIVAHMQHPKAWWNWAMSCLISDSVRLKWAFFYGKCAMSKMAFSALIRPAIIFASGFIDAPPNVVYRVCFWHKNTPASSEVKSAQLSGNGTNGSKFADLLFFAATSRPRKEYHFQSAWSTI